MIVTRKFIGLLRQKVEALKNIIAAQKARLARLEVRSIHSLEVAQENRVQSEIDQRSVMNDADLRSDLEVQYGRTRWAKRLIDEMLLKRIRSRK